MKPVETHLNRIYLGLCCLISARLHLSLCYLISTRLLFVCVVSQVRNMLLFLSLLVVSALAYIATRCYHYAKIIWSWVVYLIHVVVLFAVIVLSYVASIALPRLYQRLVFDFTQERVHHVRSIIQSIDTWQPSQQEYCLAASFIVLCPIALVLTRSLVSKRSHSSSLTLPPEPRDFDFS